MKALYWEGDGFLLLYKCLESGSFQWPCSESEARMLTPQQYRWLMEQLKLNKRKIFGSSSAVPLDLTVRLCKFLEKSDMWQEKCRDPIVRDPCIF